MNLGLPANANMSYASQAVRMRNNVTNKYFSVSKVTGVNKYIGTYRNILENKGRLRQLNSIRTTINNLLDLDRRHVKCHG